uniref:GAG-pre-integrase domain-containing protein n=1 Tax=Tanacetum cinerariifolium TaxID=118510 RepID=A0A699H6M1_TANCI|nr:hypothetical protein [Tanacetum cinerariifolium]
MMVMGAEALLNWIIDSGGSYYMTPRLDLVFDNRNMIGEVYYWVTVKRLKSKVLARGIYVKLQSSKVKVINGSRVILSGTRKDNCVYSLDGHAVESELNASVEEKDSLAQVWHKRLGHISEAGLPALEKHELFWHTTQEVIDSIHSNLWGLSQVESLGVKSLDFPRPSRWKRHFEVELKGTDQEDGDDEDAGDQETNQTSDLTDYQLVRNREPRTRMKPLRFRDESNMVAYAFVVAEEEDTHGPLTYLEAVAYEDISKSYALSEYIFLLLYVDNMLIAHKSKAEIGSTKSLLKKEFDMKELREAKKILSMKIFRDQIRKILRVLQSGLSLKDFPFMDCDVERMSKVSYAAAKEAIWPKGLLEELGVEPNTVAVNFDNQGAIHLSWNHVFHERTKHINVRYHFIREVLEAKKVKVLKVGTKHNDVDALTKVVLGLKLQYYLELLSIGIG